jgi:hypothetical protein
MAGICLAGALFVYISLVDRNMIWEDVYSQFIDLALNPERFAPELQNPQFYATDILVIILLGINYLGFYNFLSSIFIKRTDCILISVFLTLASVGVLAIVLGILHANHQWTLVLTSLSFGIILNLMNSSKLLKSIRSITSITDFTV